MAIVSHNMNFALGAFGPGINRNRDADFNLDLQTFRGDKPIRLNSRTASGTTGDHIGFQCKPAQGASTAKNVIGCEISPRVNSGVALSSSGSLIGAHIDAFLRGTAAGTIAGDVRGLNLELVTDDGGTRTISGNVSGIRMRSAFSATTITGKFCAFRIEKPEAQTNSKDYDYLFDLTGTSAAWNSAGTPSTQAGFILCRVNGVDKRIQLFTDA